MQPITPEMFQNPGVHHMPPGAQPDGAAIEAEFFNRRTDPYTPPPRPAPSHTPPVEDKDAPPTYIAEPTAALFHADTSSSVKALMSAIGQGKSTACIVEMLRISARQAPAADGVRYTRWAIVRSSFAQLKSTTIRTFQEWIPDKICPIVYDSPIRGTIDKMDLGDGTFMHVEFWFMSMDGPTAEADLASLEVTAFWINEAAEFKNKDILKNVFRRTGRYPAKKTAELTWSGVIMDYNPPALGSWLHDKFEVHKVATDQLYKIPPAILAIRDEMDPDDLAKVRFIRNPIGEGIEHQPKGLDYWLEIAEQDRFDWQKLMRFCLGQYTLGMDGTPVFPAFSEMKHVATAPIQPRRGSTLLIGMDWGLTPAACFCQYIDGRLHVLSEITTVDTDIITFVRDMVIPHLRQHYPHMKYLCVGDPAGVGRSQIDKRTPFSILSDFGLNFTQPQSNAWAVRKAAVNQFLTRADSLQVQRTCQMLVQGMLGGYHIAEPKSAHAIPTLMPVKDEFSHINDAFQAVCQYCVEGGELYSGLPDEYGFHNTQVGNPSQFEPVQDYMYF